MGFLWDAFNGTGDLGPSINNPGQWERNRRANQEPVHLLTPAEVAVRNARRKLESEAKDEARRTGRPWRDVYGEKRIAYNAAVRKASRDASDAEYLRLRALDRAAAAAEGALAPVASVAPTTCSTCGAQLPASGRCRYCRT